jgi:hypothetical protein
MVRGITIKASKVDDAEVYTWMWDADMLSDFPQLKKLGRDAVRRICEARVM